MRRWAPRGRRLVAAALACAATVAGPRPAFAQAPPAASTPALAVPYLPQSEDLCGGAAAAMVMRYWGARDIYADAFASLVDHSAGGIRTGALVHALQLRGWTALAEAGTDARLSAELERGRPVIALIAVAPRRYHYIVVVARADGRIVAHDPARAPLRTWEGEAFERVWAETGRWMLTLLPPPAIAAETQTPKADPASTPAPLTCAPLVEAGVAAATRGRSRARELLHEAARACPSASAPWRELAGLDVLEKNWGAAERDAARAVRNDAADQYAWYLLATARYVADDPTGALDAWNRLGRPNVDLVNITGLARTRYRVVYDATGLQPRGLLTASALRLAQRRVEDVPAVGSARVSFRPGDDGRAQVDVAVVEREPYPRRWPAFAAAAAGAAANRTLDLSLAGLSGGGESARVWWRFWRNRPALAFSLAAPAPRGLGLWRIDLSRETETFTPGRLRQTRTHAGLAISHWFTDRVRVAASAGVDRWREGARQGAISSGVRYEPVRDHVTVDANAATWVGGDRFSTAALDVSWRSSAERIGSILLARGGVSAASRGAPAFVWPGAGTGHLRPTLLRAHPLLTDGIVTGGVIGRRLFATGVEWQHWTAPTAWMLRYAPAVFVDAARAARGFASTDSRTQVDVGVGARLSLGGMGLVRVDVAHGLRDGANALSVALVR